MKMQRANTIRHSLIVDTINDIRMRVTLPGVLLGVPIGIAMSWITNALILYIR